MTPSSHPPLTAAAIRRVGVVGAGLMGSGIAEVCARAGLDVVVGETGPASVAAGLRRITASLDRSLRHHRLTEADREAVLRRLRFATDLGDLADRDLVIEAVAEDERIKTEVFAALDRVVTRPGAILASNTSSLPIARLATATARPDQVIGIHFFNPVPVLDLVELVPSLLTSSRTRDTCEDFVTDVLGKKVIGSQDRAGFVVNTLLVPYLLSAVRMVLGCAHRMGALRLADLIGLDTLKAIADSLYEEFKEPLHFPPPLLLRMVDAGLLARKTGRGFHDYG